MFVRLSHSSVFSSIFFLLLVQVLLISPFAAARAQGRTGSYAGEAAYQQAADQCHRLLQDSATGRSRKDWLKAVAALEQIYQKYPKSRTAPACLHLAAKMRISMYQRFRQPVDQDLAVALFHNVINLFPQSSEAANALYAIAEIEQINGNLRDAAKTYYKLTKKYPFSPRKAQAEEKLRQLTAIAKSLAARKNGRRPPPIVRAQQKKTTPSPGRHVKPAPAVSAEPEWEPIYTEPESAAAYPPPSRPASSAQRETQVVSEPVATATAPPPSASQWQEWQEPLSSASSASAERASSSISVPRAKNILPAGRPPAASARLKQEHAAVPIINFSELKIAEPDPVAPRKEKTRAATPAYDSERPEAATVSPPEQADAAANVATKPVQAEEKKESFWDRLLPDFMFGSKKEEENTTEQAVVQPATQKSEQAQKSAPMPPAAVPEKKTEPVATGKALSAQEKPKPTAPKVTAVKPENTTEQAVVQPVRQKSEQAQKSAPMPPAAVPEEKTEPVAVSKALPAQEKPESAAPKITAAKPEKVSDAGRIVVAPLQIAAMTPEAPPPEKEKKETLPAPAASSSQPEKIFRPDPKKTGKAARKPAADLLLIQHWSSDRYSRVAVNASEPTEYHVELPDRSSNAPGTLHIEFEHASAAPDVLAPMIMKDGLVKSIYTKLSGSDTVQVSLELAAAADCKVFSLNDPFRVVIDLRSLAEPEPEKTAVATAKEKTTATQDQKDHKKTDVVLEAQSKVKPVEPNKLTLAQQLGLGIKRIVIDPGHGGKDTGAVAFGLKEKNIVLKVAKRVRKILKREHYEVFLTREKDVFVPLEERTAIANTKGADLFLSIHVNAHPKSWVRGVETFYLNLAANPEAMRVAALENATSSRSMSEMENILTDLMKNTKIKESSQLAEFIQVSMAEGLRRYKIRSLGVKKAPFYVLIGAQMPAALAEISFITNKKEAQLLKDDRYLQTIAEQIAAGVTAYIEHRRTAATAALHLAAEEDRM